MLVVLESISTVFYFPMMGIIIMGTVKSWYMKTFEALLEYGKKNYSPATVSAIEALVE